MDIRKLARMRDIRAAQLEQLAGWEESSDREERRLYAEAKVAYVRAEDAFQRATATLTLQELADVLGRRAA